MQGGVEQKVTLGDAFGAMVLVFAVPPPHCYCRYLDPRYDLILDSPGICDVARHRDAALAELAIASRLSPLSAIERLDAHRHVASADHYHMPPIPQLNRVLRWSVFVYLGPLVVDGFCLENCSRGVFVRQTFASMFDSQTIMY